MGYVTSPSACRNSEGTQCHVPITSSLPIGEPFFSVDDGGVARRKLMKGCTSERGWSVMECETARQQNDCRRGNRRAQGEERRIGLGSIPPPSTIKIREFQEHRTSWRYAAFEERGFVRRGDEAATKWLHGRRDGRHIVLGKACVVVNIHESNDVGRHRTFLRALFSV